MSADVDVLVVGAGHAGLGTAARLRRLGRDVLIVDASPRVGETWRTRWASLRLFTPRFLNALPGMPFPNGSDPFPGKDEVADYQERFAAALAVPIRLGAAVTRVTPHAGLFDVAVGGGLIRARRVVVASGAHQMPRVPPFASQLAPSVLQMHSRDYGRAGALPPGQVLIVGARNSGAEIAMDLASTHDVTIAVTKPHPTYAPAHWRDPAWWRIAQLRSWLLRGAILPGPLPWPLKPPAGRWIEVDLARAFREDRLRMIGRVVDAGADHVRSDDGREVRPRTVIWATGFRVDDTWIDAPNESGVLKVGRHRRGPLPGLWVNRASLLGSLHWASLDIASDIGR